MANVIRRKFRLGETRRRGNQYRPFLRRDSDDIIEDVMDRDVREAAIKGFGAFNTYVPSRIRYGKRPPGQLKRSGRLHPTGFSTSTVYDVIVEDLYEAGGGNQNRNGRGFMRTGFDVMFDELKRRGYRIRRRGKYAGGGIGFALRPGRARAGSRFPHPHRAESSG